MDPASDRFDTCVDAVMSARGGSASWDRPVGGPSAHGVGLGLLSVWIGGPADVAALRALGRTDAARILRRMVWGPIGAGRLPAGPDLALFAYAAEAGTILAMADLQEDLGVPRSGAPDAATMTAAAAWEPGRLAALIRARHAAWRGAALRAQNPPRRVPAEAGT